MFSGVFRTRIEMIDVQLCVPVFGRLNEFFYKPIKITEFVIHFDNVALLIRQHLYMCSCDVVSGCLAKLFEHVHVCTCTWAVNMHQERQHKKELLQLNLKKKSM